MKTIVWFRNDLRLTDNPALSAAASRGKIIPLYIWAPQEEGNWPPGLMSRAWLKQSLQALNYSLKGNLIVRKGESLKILSELIQSSGAEALFFNRRYEPFAIERDLRVEKKLGQEGVEVCTFNGALLVEPWEIATQMGRPFQKFTPFWNAAVKHAYDEPIGKPTLKFAEISSSIGQLPLPDHDCPLWEIGEAGAMKRLKSFVKKGLGRYAELRDFPGLDCVSHLSPHLHFGEISPRQVVELTHSSEAFIRQLFWREFAYHLLYHFPQTADTSFQPLFRNFPWSEDYKKLEAWKRGKTGYPIIDAGMRQLLKTGWMHNRVRMLTASFLTKDLLIPWQLGARWFWERLVDADLANNTLGWQWTAGSGVDVAPFFRIFNPTEQGLKYDPEGSYVRNFVERCSAPIIDHAKARERALAIYQKLKRKKR